MANKHIFSGAEVDWDARDPEFIRRQLPLWWLLATLYFRAEVKGFERVPDGPVLFVGNHSGGALTPDTIVFMLAHNTYFSVERPLHALAHNMVTSLPGLGPFVKKLGVITAAQKNAHEALERGANVLVYPGGDVEVFRPWTKRHTIDFDGRKGFLRLAHEANVPIVPVVSDGGHDTFIVLTDGKKIARRMGMEKLGRVKTLPIALGAPGGLIIGDWLGHIPFPVKIRTEVLEPIDLRARYGDELDQDHAYDLVTSRMQAGLTELASKRTMGPWR